MVYKHAISAVVPAAVQLVTTAASNVRHLIVRRLKINRSNNTACAVIGDSVCLFDRYESGERAVLVLSTSRKEEMRKA